MKRYNLYLFTVLLSLIFLGSCSDDDKVYDNKVFVNESAKVSNLLLKANSVNDERTINVSLAKPEGKDIKVVYKADPSLLGTYNAAYYDNAVILPVANYDLPETEVVIASGSVRSTNITVYFKNLNELDRDLIYVLPVTIASSDMAILQSARTSYFVFKGAALINVVADMEDNYLHIDTWAKPEVVNNLSQVTMEALIRARNYDRQISTIMGIEGHFLIRLGDANFPSNQIQIANNGGNYPDSKVEKGLPTNEWVHIALTYDNSTKEMKVYVNGKVQSEEVRPRAAGIINFGRNGANGFYIGRSYEDSRFLAGEFSECRIWNVVRTQEQIASNAYEVEPTEAGLVAYWKCNDGGGQTVKDHTGNGNDLTAKKEIKWTPVSLPATN